MLMSFSSIDLVDCCRSVRFSSALRTAASTSTVIGWNGGRSTASMCMVQKSGDGRVEDQRPQRVFRRLDLRLADDDRLLALGDFGFRLDDVDRRRGADLDARAGVAQRLLRQLERLLLHAQRRVRVGQVPVGVAHRAQRGGDGLPHLDVGDLAVLERWLDLLPDVVDAEPAHQRLRRS